MATRIQLANDRETRMWDTAYAAAFATFAANDLLAEDGVNTFDATEAAEKALVIADSALLQVRAVRRDRPDALPIPPSGARPPQGHGQRR